MKAQLVCRPRPGNALSFVLAADEIVLGRDARLGVPLPLEGVSRRHARIVWDGRFHWLEDLRSTNGTFLNGQPVRRERLRHLDVITLGRKVDLVFALRSDEYQAERTQGVVRAALVELGGEPEVHAIPAGEVLLGRASVCNVVIDSAAVSKVHARIERRLAQVVLEDLGSSNGTFVNGVRTTTTLLHGGDSVSLGGVVEFRVEIDVGEVTATSGARVRADRLPAPTATDGQSSRVQFGSEWRTRFEWSSGELRALENLRGGAPPVPPRGGPAFRHAPTRGVPVVKPSDGQAAGPQPPVAQPSAAPPVARATPPPATPSPPERPPAQPTSTGKRATPPAPVGRDAAREAPPSPRGEQPIPAKPGAAAPREHREGLPPAEHPPAPTRAEAPAAEAPAAEAPAPPAPPRVAPARIAEVRLEGSGFDLAVSDAGAHQLGRSADSRLRVDHPTVSRRHARLILAEDRTAAYVQDLGGANGTLLNGQAIQALAPLQSGDRVRIGEVELTVTFRKG